MAKVAVFKAYPFEVGQKIRIEESPRFGDWEVTKVTEHKVTLKCPISKREMTWSRFCYLAGEQDMEWPQPD
ncbi:MAG: hypothetical protein MI802_07210 [Desulfobacterales bacterium]|nr:hypothetical protein [Desulfobacterales bacterium]